MERARWDHCFLWTIGHGTGLERESEMGSFVTSDASIASAETPRARTRLEGGHKRHHSVDTEFGLRALGMFHCLDYIRHHGNVPLHG